MSVRFVFGLMALLLVSCKGKSEYENKLDMFRSRQIAFFALEETSPLDSLERINFKGIKYFAINESLRITASLMWLPQTVFTELKHTGGDSKPYMRVAEIHFSVFNKPQKLMAYQTADMANKHTFFIPFSDPTNGVDTYGGGRYLDVIYNPASTQLELDFNFAYAPYCAYTHHYSCPMIPAGNNLTVKIEAGERL